MANSVFPSQMGFVPSGTNQQSQLVFGRNITGIWEAIGIGAGGRPDTLQSITTYLTNVPQDGTPATLPVIITIDTSAVQTVIGSNLNAPQVFNFTLQEAATCEATGSEPIEMRRMVLMSQPYLPA